MLRARVGRRSNGHTCKKEEEAGGKASSPASFFPLASPRIVLTYRSLSEHNLTQYGVYCEIEAEFNFHSKKSVDHLMGPRFRVLLVGNTIDPIVVACLRFHELLDQIR
jgi:hypothetical protein